VSRKQGGIGDVLMTLPTVKAIARKYNIKVDYATDFDYLDGALPKVLQGNPYIDKIFSWKKIDTEEYDAIVELTCPCVEHEVPKAPPVNRIDLFARHTGIALTDHDIDYTVFPDEEEWAKDYLKTNNLHRSSLLLVQPSASASARDCPHPLLQRAIANILMLKRNMKALIITHGSDNVHTEWNIHNTHVFHNMDVRQIAAIMPFSDLVVCPDSAVLHLAAAHHHPTLTLFGPTDPRARVNYHPEAVAIWPAGQLNNYPTWYENPNDGYLCWKIIEEKYIVKTAIAILDNKPLPYPRQSVTFGSFVQENQHFQNL
jgi:ADP-heptose:LPS heptosyltransferase